MAAIIFAVASLTMAHPIPPNHLEVFPQQDPRRWTRNPSPPEVTPKDFVRIFPGIDSITITTESLPPHVRGDTNPLNLEIVLKVAKWLNPKTILEVGTFRGRTTLALGNNTSAERIVTVDLPLGENTEFPWYGTDAEYLRVSDRPVFFQPSERIHQVYADCTSRSALIDVLNREFPDTTIDFAYIDAAHTYEGVIVPFETVLSKLSPGGIIAFDDYLSAGFVPVTEAISYLSREKGYVFYIFTCPNPTGVGVKSTVLFINDPLCKNRDWKQEVP
jgi:predicted O-methyltransferase YrrM